MTKQFTCFIFLFLFSVYGLFAQDTTFLLIGPSFGINKSWRSYDIPITTFKVNPMVGFEGGVDIFYKSKGKFGFSGDLSFLKTKSAITVYEDYQEIEVNETAKWLTAGANIIFFPLPKSKTLPFLGTGMQIAYLHSSHASLNFTIYPDLTDNLKTDLNDLRTNQNYFFKLVGGITIHQIDKHRIILLATYSKMLGQLAEENLSFYGPKYLGYDYSINSLTLKLMMAL